MVQEKLLGARDISMSLHTSQVSLYNHISFNSSLYFKSYKLLKLPTLKGHLSLFFIIDPISRHISKAPHVFRIFEFDLKSVKIFEMHLRRY